MTKKKLHPMPAPALTARVPVSAVERWLLLQFLDQAKDAGWEEQEKRDDIAEVLEAGESWRKTNQRCPLCRAPNGEAEAPEDDELEEETEFTMTKRMMKDLQSIIKAAHKPEHGLSGRQKRYIRKLHARLLYILEGKDKDEASAA